MDEERAAILLERVSTLARAASREMAAEHGLRPAQLEVLGYLGRANRYSDSVVAVASYFEATKGTTSQTVNALESKGLLEKRQDKGDKRLYHCRLTAAGKRVVAQTSPSPMIVRALGQAGVDLTPALETLLRAMQRRNDGKSFGLCRTCQHFERGERSHRCGLTGERLTQRDASRICREHLPVVA